LKSDNVSAYEDILNFLKENEVDVKSMISSMNLSSKCKLNRHIIDEI